MRHIHTRFAVLALLCAGMIGAGMTGARAATQIQVPQNFTVPANASAGASFTYTGVALPSDTLSITVAGPVYLETGPAYGTNAAGVVTLAGVNGNQPVGSALACATIDSIEFDCGSMIVYVTSGSTTYYGRLFLATRKDGFGRTKPPVQLTYKGSLKKLFGKDSGYKKFKFKNPTFTFLLSDTLYSDNTGAFAVSNN